VNKFHNSPIDYVTFEHEIYSREIEFPITPLHHNHNYDISGFWARTLAILLDGRGQLLLGSGLQLTASFACASLSEPGPGHKEPVTNALTGSAPYLRPPTKFSLRAPAATD
jgi:hypothetical protein